MSHRKSGKSLEDLAHRAVRVSGFTEVPHRCAEPKEYLVLLVFIYHERMGVGAGSGLGGVAKDNRSASGALSP